jgi:predicted negative regulator of RcsB-dependent stress response
MASPLDLQEQEQLDSLKAFWKQYGNPITWLLIVLLGAYAGWNGWQYWQRDQGVKAGAMFDELERSVQAGDAERTARVFKDLQERYGRTVQAAQAGLLTARVQFDKGQLDAARGTLTWVAEQGGDEALRTVARLRLAGLLLEAKQPDEALKQLDGASAPGFEALVADRRGDVLLAKGDKAGAKAAYDIAFKGMEERQDYRRLVEAKLTALGAAPAASAAAPGAAK